MAAHLSFWGGVSSQRRSRFKRATRSLSTFVRTAQSLCSASLATLAHSLRSLPRGTIKILEYVFILLSRFKGTNAFLALTRNTP